MEWAGGSAIDADGTQNYTNLIDIDSHLNTLTDSSPGQHALQRQHGAVVLVPCWGCTHAGATEVTGEPAVDFYNGRDHQ
jgi:hypothetical protein